MQIKRIVPIVTTERLAEAKEFYVSHFGFRVAFESEDHLSLKSSKEDGVEISLMRPKGNEQPLFDGKGIVYCLEVADVDAEHEKLMSGGLTDQRPPQDNPWGDRSFSVVDPCGITLYIYKPIPAEKEFKQYFKR